MAEQPPTPFAPLDQYQPFVDEFGRVSQEWYTWLDKLCRELNRLRAIEEEVARVRAGHQMTRPEGGRHG